MTEPLKETKKLRRTGNSSGVTLSKPILAAVGLTTGSEVVVTVLDGQIIITPAHSVARRTEEAGRAVLEQYRYAFERLGYEGRMP